MFLYPIVKRQTPRFTWAIEKDTLDSHSPESLIEALHNAACIPNGEGVTGSLNLFVENRKEYYNIYLNSSVYEKTSDLGYRLCHFGVVRAHQKEKWWRENSANRTIANTLAIMQRIEQSPYLNFSMLVVDKSLFSVFFENETLEFVRGINNFETGNNTGILSLLNTIYTLLRPKGNNISKAKPKEKREFVNYMIKIMCEQASYLQESELLSLCSSLESDFGATFKNALLKVVQKSADWNLRTLAAFLTKKYNFSRNEKGIDAFFGYIEQFDGFDIAGFLGENADAQKQASSERTRIGNIIENIPHNFTAYFLDKLFALAEDKHVTIELLLCQHINATWRKGDPTGFIYKLLHQKFVDNNGIARIENMLTNYTAKLSTAKANEFKEAFFCFKSRRFNWNCHELYRSDDPYAFLFVQTWLNNDKCLPPIYIHQAIQFDAVNILEFFKQQQGFDIFYKETVDDDTITWETVRCTNAKDETLQFIGRCLAESGKFDAMSLNELLDLVSKARKTFKPVFKYLNAYLETPITTGNVEINSMKHARAYMAAFGASPMEVLPLAMKNDTKHRLLKELVR